MNSNKIDKVQYCKKLLSDACDHIEKAKECFELVEKEYPESTSLFWRSFLTFDNGKDRVRNSRTIIMGMQSDIERRERIKNIFCAMDPLIFDALKSFLDHLPPHERIEIESEMVKRITKNIAARHYPD